MTDRKGKNIEAVREWWNTHTHTRAVNELVSSRQNVSASRSQQLFVLTLTFVLSSVPVRVIGSC